jgi:hypothetical protein
MQRRHLFSDWLSLIAVNVVVIILLVAYPTSLAGEVKVETVLTGLKGPCGVAVRPDLAGAPYEIFVADRGAGRVVQVGGGSSPASLDAITGFPVGAASSGGALCAPGVQSLFFLDHARLVAAGGEENGKPFLRLYDLAESDSVLKADDHKQDLDFTSDAANPKAPMLCFHDLTRTQPNDRVSDMLIMAASEENGASALWKVPVRANTLGDAAAFKVAKEFGKVVAVGGLTTGNDGYIVIACRSASTSDSASSLKFINPINGRVALAVDTELPRVAAVSYCPTNRNLYAVSFSSIDEGGGVYRIDDAGEPGKPAGKATKIAAADRPTALTFGPDGALYVSVLGTDEQNGKEVGVLLKISGEL